VQNFVETEQTQTLNRLIKVSYRRHHASRQAGVNTAYDSATAVDGMLKTDDGEWEAACGQCNRSGGRQPRKLQPVGRFKTYDLGKDQCVCIAESSILNSL
jgi:hypothetical protein